MLGEIDVEMGVADDKLSRADRLIAGLLRPRPDRHRCCNKWTALALVVALTLVFFVLDFV
jgi:hypothetical protein